MNGRKDGPENEEDFFADRKGRLETPAFQPKFCRESRVFIIIIIAIVLVAAAVAVAVAVAIAIDFSVAWLLDEQFLEHQADCRLDLAPVAGCAGTLHHYCAASMIENGIYS
jgi:hypothetical protein